MKFYKYQGAGNDFLIADNRDGKIAVKDGSLYDGMETVRIADICDRRYGVGADGLMLLERSGSHDFTMVYFNSDGSGGMMCGNGGRCIVAFAADCGIGHFDFEAADGFHTAEILSEDGRTKTVRLKMKDVDGIKVYGNIGRCTTSGRMAGTITESKTGGAECVAELNGCFLDTGTRHFVTFTENVSGCDVVGVGRKIRYMDEFGPVGTNVNLVEQDGFSLKVRTYEKGVEDETFACGTGIVASSVAAWYRMSSCKSGGLPEGNAADGEASARGRVRFDVRAVRDVLAVDFLPGMPDAVSGTSGKGIASDVWLTGPATFVAEVKI